MIEVKGISKLYGSVLAVDDVSFQVNQGEIVGFLGPNGAGKSTTMKVLTGYLAPSSGTAVIDGHDILEEPVEARAAVGYLPESTPLYEEMGVVDYLRFMAQMQGVPPAKLQARVDQMIDVCAIGPMAHKDIAALSKGYRQRVGLAQALLSDPPVLILDEPTSGLDPRQIVEIRALIREIAKEKCILLSTHILPEAQNICDRILIISQGRLVGEGTPGELLNLASGAEFYTVTLKGRPAGAIQASLGRLPGVTEVELLGENGVSRFRVSAPRDSELNESIFDLAVADGLKLLELNRTATSLERIFLQLTGQAASGDALTGAAHEAHAESAAEPADTTAEVETDE